MNAAPTTKLTTKEKQFAAALAAGATMAAAYKQVYSDRAGRRAAEANARQILRRERVVAEVQRLRRYPPPDNFTAIQEYAIAKLIDMAESDSNPAVRHRAMTTLLEHADKGLRQPPPPRQAVATADKKDDNATLIADLHVLYQKALGSGMTRPAQIQRLPEAQDNDVLVEEDITPERGDTRLVESAMEFSPIHGHGEQSDDDRVGEEERRRDGGAVLREAAEEIAVQADEYQWVSVPGSFGKARRMRVRVR